MAQSTVGSPNSFPMRVIDSDFTVIKQNYDMRELTGINAYSQDVDCHDQLFSSLCETEQCPLNRFQDVDGQGPELRYGDTDIIVTEIEVELPNGETKFMSMVSERILDKSGEPGAIIQSFRDMGISKPKQEPTPEMLLPEPRDSASFRNALKALLERAAANGVAVFDRPENSSLTESHGQWEIEISKRQSQSDDR